MVNQNRIKAIDGIRGGSALIIACIYHLATVPFKYSAGLPFNYITLIGWLYRRGGYFVEFFLVISGYISCVVYTEKINKGLSLSQYAARRIIRIFPLMWATLAISTVGNIVYWLLHSHAWWVGGVDNTLVTFVFSCLGLQAFYPGAQPWNYPAWSLSVFFVCWFIYWMIIRFSQGRKELQMYLCLAMVLFGIGLTKDPLQIQVFLFDVRMARGYISFFSGGLVNYIQKRIECKNKKSELIIWIALVLLVALHALRIPTGNHTILFGAFIFPCVLFLALQSNILNRLLSFPPFVFLGKISFSIYLCNYSIEIFTIMIDEYLGLNINYSSPVFFFSNIAIHIVIATIFWKIFEDIIPKKLKAKYLTST